MADFTEKEIIDTSRLILSEIGSARKWSRSHNMTDLFLSCENLISGLAFLIGPLMDREQKYRAEVQKNIDEGMSVAASEAKAKAGIEYIKWRKLHYVYNIAEEQIKLLKKFSDKIESEYNRS